MNFTCKILPSTNEFSIREFGKSKRVSNAIFRKSMEWKTDATIVFVIDNFLLVLLVKLFRLNYFFRQIANFSYILTVLKAFSRSEYPYIKMAIQTSE